MALEQIKYVDSTFLTDHEFLPNIDTTCDPLLTNLCMDLEFGRIVNEPGKSNYLGVMYEMHYVP
jgi:hypothetical protein